MSKKLRTSAALGALLLGSVSMLSMPAYARHLDVDHVLLISVDGMHALDYLNCVSGGYCPNLAALGTNGVNYLDTSTSKPSDSFPGLMALMTGGSPRTMGVNYDVAYDRALYPPQNDTGNGLSGTGATCTGPSGTSTEYDEGIDIDQTQLNGGAPSGVDGGVNSIDPTRLERDQKCNPVYPWNFVRVNTIFGVIHGAKGYTAWSDKHPSYSSVGGPSSGTKDTNVDDYYSPEINSTVVPLNVTTPLGLSCNPIPDATADLTAYTNSFENIQCYDTLKVNAILNEIDGKTHNGKASAPVPSIFGMNFQAVSIGQKLIETTLSATVTGGYTDSIGTPTASLLQEIKFVDASIGQMIAELKKQGLLNSTLIIITAKHGQSPVDSSRYQANGKPNDPAWILDSCLPASESHSGGQIGPTEDDVALLWLNGATGCDTATEVSALEAASPALPLDKNKAGIGQIFSGPSIGLYWNIGDSRTPDILVTPNIGVTYSNSTTKLAEHGGFAHDDTNVIMLVSNPGFHNSTVTSPVETAQVAPTILEALGLDPNSLQAVQTEGTQVLPGLSF